MFELVLGIIIMLVTVAVSAWILYRAVHHRAFFQFIGWVSGIALMFTGIVSALVIILVS